MIDQINGKAGRHAGIMILAVIYGWMFYDVIYILIFYFLILDGDGNSQPDYIITVLQKPLNEWNESW